MRIIAGRLRGRKFKAPSGMATRPTLDRVREALFSILGDLRDAHVIDAYAGTGALGIEALSRGAAHAGFVENSTAAAFTLRENLESLGVADRATLIQAPMELSRARLKKLEPTDLLLADPPWAIAQEAATTILAAMEGRWASGARLVLGHSAAEPVEIPDDCGFRVADRRHWGGSGMSFFELISDT